MHGQNHIKSVCAKQTQVCFNIVHYSRKYLHHLLNH